MVLLLGTVLLLLLLGTVPLLLLGTVLLLVLGMRDQSLEGATKGYQDLNKGLVIAEILLEVVGVFLLTIGLNQILD